MQLKLQDFTMADAKPVQMAPNAAKGKDTVDNTSPGIVKEDAPQRRLTTQQKIERLTAAMHRLKNTKDFLTEEAAEDFKLINVRFSNVARNEDQKLNLHAIELGIVELCLDVWKQMFELDFMDPKDKAIWNIMYRALSSLWNGSDQCKYICEKLLNNDGHKYFLEIIQHPKIVADKREANPIQIYTVCGGLGIIHNMLQHLGESGRNLFRQLNAVEILQKFLQNKSTLINVKAFINLAYLVTDEENELINADEVHLQYIVDLLKDAVDSTNKRSKKGFGAFETIEALNKLAVNDNNKERIFNCGALEHYGRLLTNSTSEDEQVKIIHGLWIMSFNKKCRDAMNDMPELLSLLHKLSSSPAECLQKVVNGALWVLQAHRLQKESRPTKDNDDTEHVMISYSCDDQATAMKIKEGLTEAGFKIWMDTEHVSGPPIDAMADAVGKAAVFVLCMSNNYKNNPSCRTEAEYAYQLRKPFIPLRLEAGYKADGWLGLITGTKLWFDFTNAKRFQPAVTSLMKELGNRGRLTRLHELPMVHVLVEELGKNKKLIVWSQEDVEDWLRNSGLNHLSSKWPWMDGSLLQEVKEMRKDAPEFFYKYMKDDLQFNFQDVLKLTKALKKLQ